MGNCIETCIDSPQVEKQHQHEEEEKEKAGDQFVQGSGYDHQTNSRMRIKIVLTKEELGWLLCQLQYKEGNKKKKLEDVLEEIERSRGGKVNGWKPSLESIMESPEVLQINDR